MNHFTATAALTLAAVIGAGSASAADVTFLDLRFGGGVLSNEFKGSSSTTVTNNNTQVATNTNSGEDGRNSDGNYRGQVQLVYGNLGPVGGLILGANVAVNHAQFDNGNYDSTVTTPVLDVMIGYGIAVTPEWHFELTPFAGYGRAFYSVTTSNSTSTSNDSTDYVEYGGRLGTYYTFPNGLQLGVEVPYLVGRYNPEYNHESGTDTYNVSDERRSQGFGVLASVGVRF